MPKKLLPVGFYDLLFDEAKKNHENANAALATFFAGGYHLIKTPLLEFEENFSSSEIQNSFRSIDIISGKSLVLRNDITLQISRIFETYSFEKKLPLRLCYVGDVFCAKSEDLYVDRQQTQVGVELIGSDDKNSNLEIIEILLVALQKIGVKNLLIEFSLPNFLRIFLEEIGEKNCDEIRQAVMKKNLSAIRKLSEKNSEIISKIALSNHDLKNLGAEIFAKTKSEKIREALNLAQKISEFLSKNFSTIEARFDLFGDQNSSYHSDIAFDVFCEDFSYPIARGGSYRIGATGAIGATIYMNRLRKISA